MSTTIEYSGGTLFPTLVEGFRSERESGTVVHPVIGRPAPDVTIRPAGLRTGRLVLVFRDSVQLSRLVVIDGYVQAPLPPQSAEAASKTAEDAHAAGGVFTLTPSGRPTLRFAYVPHGLIVRELDDATRSAWRVEFDFHEVIP